MEKTIELLAKIITTAHDKSDPVIIALYEDVLHWCSGILSAPNAPSTRHYPRLLRLSNPIRQRSCRHVSPHHLGNLDTEVWSLLHALLLGDPYTPCRRETAMPQKKKQQQFNDPSTVPKRKIESAPSTVV